MRLRERSAADETAVIDYLRSASERVRIAINKLGGLAPGDVGDLGEARAQLLAAMHLIDGVGVALRRNGR